VRSALGYPPWGRFAERRRSVDSDASWEGIPVQGGAENDSQSSIRKLGGGAREGHSGAGRSIAGRGGLSNGMCRRANGASRVIQRNSSWRPENQGNRISI